MEPTHIILSGTHRAAEQERYDLRKRGEITKREECLIVTTPHHLKGFHLDPKKTVLVRTYDYWGNKLKDEIEDELVWVMG